MKIGLILECQRGGPDQQIYEHLIREFYPEAHVETYPQTNKRILMEQAPTVCVDALNTDKCDFVFIIWDLSPAHPDKKAKLCLKTEKDLLLTELRAKRVASERFKLVCVEYELESFLIADGRGLTKLKQSIAKPHRVKDFPDCKKKRQRNPKNVIWNYYDGYLDSVHAIQILRNLEGDYKRMRRNNACFDRFMVTVETLKSTH